jgi:6-pyruvoyltetrahydropterin/6-carboxytetrahydropterin synthase
MAKYQSTKTYGTDRGLSCCFRQWKANHSHCSTLHGYSLGFKFVFESETLDEKNWCFDFGGMKPIKAYLDHMFDHTILVAEDDPAREVFETFAKFALDANWNGKASSEEDGSGFTPTPYSVGRLCDLRIVPGVGCELTAKLVYDKSVELLEKMKKGELGRYAVNPDVRLVSVECFEHGANSAIYLG